MTSNLQRCILQRQDGKAWWRSHITNIRRGSSGWSMHRWASSTGKALLSFVSTSISLTALDSHLVGRTHSLHHSMPGFSHACPCMLQPQDGSYGQTLTNSISVICSIGGAWRHKSGLCQGLEVLKGRGGISG